jgi:CRISPR-associated endonuclease Csn1
MVGYNHSSSLTKEENENRPLKDTLELLPKNSLRNPVVEKILNQVVNIVNAIIADPDLGKPDEIRIELARELKSSATERKETTININKAKTAHDNIRATLISEDGIKNPTRNDIIRYKLYQELKNNGYKDLYTNTYIPREKLFSKEFDIEHIIPQMKVFDDSFSNKTIVPRQVNIEKGNKTAYDYISEKFGANGLEEYVARVEMMQKDNSIGRAKFQKLLKKEKEIGDNFIERDLRNSQYIAKKARQMLLEICRTVVSTTGNVTARLREDWGLINIMQELNMEKFRAANLTQMIEKKDGTSQERIIDWTKRNDHRHHAMDALTVAFTKHNHIQYLNYLNARRNEKHEKHKTITAIQNKETELVYDDLGNKKRKFKSPIPNFRQEAKKHLESVLVSFKAKNKVVTKNKNRTKHKNGDVVKIELTPRGQLHKETVYGKMQQYVTKEERVGPKFDIETIQKVASKTYRNALRKRLEENGNDPKKAFSGKNSLINSPVYLDPSKTMIVPDKVKLVWLEDNYTIRKSIAPDLKIDKVIDVGIRRILQERLDLFKGNAKEAFVDLEKNPIWQNKEKGIAIKRVIISGVKNAETIAHKKDHHGNKMINENGKHIPADFVSTGNNHHVAVYRDEKGALQENVVSFFEAVMRVNQGLPIIDKSFKKDEGWSFLFTMKQNEYFVFPSDGFDPNEIDLLNPENYQLISENLFRVQKITTKDYVFNHHLETQAVNADILKIKELSGVTYRRVRTPTDLKGQIKVRLNHIGQIVKVNEY